ncbi:MAG: nuclear transport factor 2 family protein [Sphaerochaeta sp.]
MNQNIEMNKQNAIAFYKMAYLGNPSKAVELYVGNEYIQHNPTVADGKEGFIDYFTLMQQEFPEKSIEFVREIAQDDLVSLHTHQIWPGNDQYITMDFFRFDDYGKIVEHWDSIQQIPNKTKSGNTMY